MDTPEEFRPGDRYEGWTAVAVLLQDRHPSSAGDQSVTLGFQRIPVKGEVIQIDYDRYEVTEVLHIHPARVYQEGMRICVTNVIAKYRGSVDPPQLADLTFLPPPGV